MKSPTPSSPSGFSSKAAQEQARRPPFNVWCGLGSGTLARSGWVAAETSDGQVLCMDASSTLILTPNSVNRMSLPFGIPPRRTHVRFRLINPILVLQFGDYRWVVGFACSLWFGTAMSTPGYHSTSRWKARQLPHSGWRHCQTGHRGLQAHLFRLQCHRRPRWHLRWCRAVDDVIPAEGIISAVQELKMDIPSLSVSRVPKSMRSQGPHCLRFGVLWDGFGWGGSRVKVSRLFSGSGI